ncbi:patatin-like phospholipase family protein [Nonlabens mediterrranea]|uniref:Patatin-like phospholipase family protein n=2 Tax=Nonlabens mediterrranea TaxID=1419947 RepID=A0ABS0A7B6_9FLAO|nr:patatin-like phospholipase family protein [Nonlabens mediterrranea]
MKIGLALSGGGAKGIAHAGVLKVLKEREIEIHKVSGTSAGALIGALFAADLDIESIYEFFRSSNLFHPSKFAFGQPGFIKSNVFIDHISSYIPLDSFESLKLPLIVAATDLNKAKLKVFDSGELYMAILASAAFPGVFTPITIDDNVYIDGGVINNFPIDLLDDCDIKLGSYVNKLEPLNKKMKHSYDVAGRAYSIGQYHRDSSKFYQADILFEPEELYSYGLFSFRSLRKMFDIGYENASRQLDKSPLFK